MRLIPTRFSIRGLMLLAALVAGFLAWRLRNAESTIIAAINNAGGQAVLGYQFQYCEERSWSASVASRSQPEPPRRLVEFVFGDCRERRVRVVELPIENITPELVEKLKGLSSQILLVIKMPIRPSNQDVSSDFQQRVMAIKAANSKYESIVEQLNAIWGDKIMFDCGLPSYSSNYRLQSGFYIQIASSQCPVVPFSSHAVSVATESR